ncbi:MAG: cytochrome c [Beijerinckiaceae bacterium]|jgi:mono/diheme cytochrome c family protein|nr:cytochrome c [Beijerinckiaceae bacterium]
MFRVVLLSGLAIAALGAGSASAQQANVARGKYLATISGCNDCHTPGSFFGKRDVSKTLSGSEVAFEIPGMGAFVGPNLTPDKATGLGNWSTEQIVAAIRTGKRPDGRELAPIMPWRDLASLSDSDARSIALYLRNLPPIANKVPGPFGPGEKVTTLTMKISPPQN